MIETVNLSRGYPRYNPGEFTAADLLARGEVDAALIVGSETTADLSDAAELKDALLIRRNANWARWVRGRLDKPGTVMVAVGAGHLAGDQSVVSFLQKDGVKVTRVQ